MKSSINGKDLSIMVNSAHIPSGRQERHCRHAPSMQDLPSLMQFLGMGIQKYPSSPTRINSVSKLSGMECVVYSLYQTPTIKRRSAILFDISLDLPWPT